MNNFQVTTLATLEDNSHCNSEEFHDKQFMFWYTVTDNQDSALYCIQNSSFQDYQSNHNGMLEKHTHLDNSSHNNSIPNVSADVWWRLPLWQEKIFRCS